MQPERLARSVRNELHKATGLVSFNTVRRHQVESGESVTHKNSDIMGEVRFMVMLYRSISIGGDITTNDRKN